MEIETVANNGFDVVMLRGSGTISALASLTPAFTSLMQEHPQNSIVIDMSQVSSIDTSVIRLFQNIKKKMDASQRKLFLLHPSTEHTKQIAAVMENTPIPIIERISELQQNVNARTYQNFLPFTIEENQFLRMRLSCGICGSPNVYGYLFNKNDYLWNWPTEDYFPECTAQTGESFDLFSALPIICADCLTASIELSSFNILSEDNVIRHHSSFNDQTKLLLSKALKKRKKLIDEIGVTIGDNFFKVPRNRVATLNIYLLSEMCSRIIAINHNEVTMFTVGFLNYITLLYCERTMKTGLIDNCRSFLTQVISSPGRYNHVQLSQAYFILFISALSLGKMKDITSIMENYSTHMEQAGTVNESVPSIDSAAFWFNRADEIWKQEISKKSSLITS